MHKKFSRAVIAGIMAVAMLAPMAAEFAPIDVSAGQVLGETSFDYKALPWHTCETSPAKQEFELTKEGDNGVVHLTVLVPEGGDGEKWDLQFRCRNLNFKANHEYKVSFKVKAKRAGMQLCSKIGNIKGDEEYFELDGNQGNMHMGPHMGGQYGSAAILSTDWQTYEGIFKPTQDLEGIEWAFHYAMGHEFEGNAQEGDELWFDDMSIECLTCDDCDADPGKSYGATDRNYSVVGHPELQVDGEPVNFISVNQIGYYSNLAKIATLGDNQGDIVYGATKISIGVGDTYDFELVDSKSNKVVYEGTSGKAFKDPDSADTVCKLDFSDYTTPGRYFLRIKGKDWRSFDFNIGDNIYSDDSHDLLTNAVNYFYQNRSGIDIEDKYCTSGGSDGKGTGMGHEGGHKTDTASIQKIWKNEYASKEEATGTYASGTMTASGGWYDAGDHGKYVVNGGISVWTLQNMYERAITVDPDAGNEKFADDSGTIIIPENGNKIPDILDECAYELDWMTKMVVQPDDPTWGKYAGMVYHKLHDHKWTGLATRPWDYEKEWETVRIVKPPTFAATLNYAACAAQAARLWKDYDAEKAAFYLDEAKKAYAAYEAHYYPADLTQGSHFTKEEENETSLYAPMYQAKGGGPYGDTEVKDDAYWAACEIFVSASEMGDADASTYFDKLSEYKDAFKVTTRCTGGENKGSFTSFNWGNTASAGSLTLALHEDLLDDTQKKTVEDSIVEAAQAYVDEEAVQGYGIPYKYDGDPYNDPNNLPESVMIQGYEWGSNSMVINNTIVMAYAYDLTGDVTYMNGVVSALDYLLGCNPLSFSFVSGYGSYKLTNPHHRYWSYELDKTLPLAPDGVLSGGPNAGLQDPYVRALGFVPGDDSNPSQRCYVDSIEAWSTNEVTINWNAPLAWIASFMQDEAAEADGSGTTTKPTKPTTPTEGESDTKPSVTGDIIWGDADCNGTVNLSDVIAVNQMLMNVDGATLTDQGITNADVDQDGAVAPYDALNILQLVIEILTQADFPIAAQ